VTAAAVVAQVGYDYVVRHQLGVVGPGRTALFLVVVSLRAATAAAFVIGLRRQGAARSAVVDLVGGLEGPDSASPDRLAAALRRALGDPSLELVPWSTAEQSYVDAEGRRPVLPVAAPGRAVTVVEQDGAPVAALVHDEALLEDPGLVGAVVAAVRLTSDNERLRAELQRQLTAVAESRSRIVAAGDEERHRIERDLHDGAQQRLVTIALALRLADARLGSDSDPEVHDALSQAVKDLGEAIDELRDLARGIHPAILTESGLSSALESLVDRSPVPASLDMRVATEPPMAVAATAYFAASEAMTNVVKHAHATRIRVEVRIEGGELRVLIEDDGVGRADPAGGSGLRGLADRVDAGGGTLRVTSPPSGGTRLDVRLPCA
jgi:signal transduction histidine kinase